MPGFPKLEPFHRPGLVPSEAEVWTMLVERGVRVLNMEVVGDAYAISANYLRRTGAIADDIATDERRRQIIGRMFHRGEINKLKLANKAIAEFEATVLA